MKIKTAAVVVIAALSTQGAFASAKRFPISANVAYTSNYCWRGITQSNDNFSLQGGFNYAHESGLYLGTWAAGVEFVGSTTGVARPAAFQELEAYGGFKGKLGADLTYDLGFMRYAYPGANSSLNYDFNEVYTSVGYRLGALEVGAGVNYSSDFWAGSGDATFTHVSADYKLDTNWSIAASIGHQSVEDNEAFGDEDYSVINVTGSYALDHNYTASVGWSKTDLEGHAGDSKVYVTLSMGSH